MFLGTDRIECCCTLCVECVTRVTGVQAELISWWAALHRMHPQWRCTSTRPVLPCLAPLYMTYSLDSYFCSHWLIPVWLCASPYDQKGVVTQPLSSATNWHNLLLGPAMIHKVAFTSRPKFCRSSESGLATLLGLYPCFEKTHGFLDSRQSDCGSKRNRNRTGTKNCTLD